MHIHFLDKRINYNGTQLHSHWIFESTGILGDSLVGFVGACDVGVENLVDLEDVRNEQPIFSQSMLHFIGEFFDISLKETVLLQRLLISLIQQRLKESVGAQFIAPIIRMGNDLYERDLKLTVSIATASPVSTLIHAGINIKSERTPVPTKGLNDYGIEPIVLAEQILDDFKEEFESIQRDLAKVRAVK